MLNAVFFMMSYFICLPVCLLVVNRVAGLQCEAVGSIYWSLYESAQVQVSGPRRGMESQPILLHSSRCRVCITVYCFHFLFHCLLELPRLSPVCQKQIFQVLERGALELRNSFCASAHCWRSYSKHSVVL